MDCSFILENFLVSSFLKELSCLAVFDIDLEVFGIHSFVILDVLKFPVKRISQMLYKSKLYIILINI
jgi:hypothetical protein